MGAKAEESHQIQKARKKLRKQLEEESKQINQKAIDQMKQAIQIYIQRHQDERIELKEERFTLFDENKHPAKAKSKHVNQLLTELRKEKEKTQAFKPLIGRIKK